MRIKHPACDELLKLVKKILIAILVLFAVAAAAWLSYPTYKQWKQNRFLTQARAALAQADYRNAAFNARKTLEINPVNVEASRLMAQIAEQLKIPQAIIWRARVVEQEPEVATNRLELARTALLFGNIAYADRALQGIKPADSASVDFHILSAMTAFAQNKLAAAEEHCSQAARLDPQNKFARFNLAVLQLQSTNSTVFEAAIKTLEQLSTDPAHNRDALRNLIAATLKRNEFTRARTWSKQLLTVEPLAFPDRLLHLTVLKESSSPEFADYLSSLESLAAQDAKDVNALGSWFRAHRLSDEAIQWLLHLPEKVRAERSATELLAECYADRRDWTQVETLLADEKWADMEFIRLALLAHARRQLNQKYSSQADWQAAVSAASEKLKALQALFEMASRWNWQPEQEELAWKIIQQFPGERPVLTMLEKIYTSTSNSYGLQKVYAAMMKYASPDPVARNNFAAISLLLNRQVSEACEIARVNYNEHPEDGVIASTHAYALHLQGHTGEGLKVLEKLKEPELQKPAVATYYGLLLAADGQTNKARPYLAIAAKSTQLLPEEKTLITKATANNSPSH